MKITLVEKLCKWTELIKNSFLVLGISAELHCGDDHLVRCDKNDSDDNSDENSTILCQIQKLKSLRRGDMIETYKLLTNKYDNRNGLPLS